MLSEEKVIHAINQVLNMKLDPKNTPVDETLKSLGIDSLDMFSVLVELESISGKSIPDSDVDKLTTIRSLVNYFF